MTLKMHFKSSKTYFNLLTAFTFLIALAAVLLLVGRILSNPSPIDSLKVTPLFYTTQSNLLVLLVMSLFIVGCKSQKWFQILSLIAVIDILLTAIVFHLFLSSYIDTISFMQQMLHTWTPLFYFLFYFIVLQNKLTIRYFWVSIIHPVIFFISVFTWIEPYFGTLIETTVIEFEGSRYIYPFLNPSNFQLGFAGVLLFCFVLIMPLIIFLSIMILYAKKRISNNILKII